MSTSAAAAPDGVSVSVTPDRFHGRIVAVHGARDDDATHRTWFEGAVAGLMTDFASSGVRGVWVQVPSTFLAGAAVLRDAHGFRIHHANPEHLMMTRWLPDPEADPDKIPPFAHFYASVGAVVLRDRDDDLDVLVLTERWSFDEMKRWKPPGGYIDAGEHFGKAAEREVFEETGLKVKFERLLAVRHTTTFVHGCADAHFMCLLSASDPSADPVADQVEVLDARWMPVSELLADPHVLEVTKEFVVLAVAARRSGQGWERAARALVLPGRSRPWRYDLYACDPEAMLALRSEPAASGSTGGAGDSSDSES